MYRRALLFVLFTGFSLIAYCQKTNSDSIYMNVEQPAEFRGGIKGMKRYFSSHLVYPESAVRNRIQGKVFLKLVIDAKGRVTQVKLIQGVSPELDAEAIRVCWKMPRWKPGRHNGKNVAMYYNMPVSFKLL